MMQFTNSEIILAITCAAFILWLFLFAPRRKRKTRIKRTRRNTFKIKGKKKEREQSYIDECWNEVEGHKTKNITTVKQPKRSKRKITKMPEQKNHTLLILIIIILLNMVISLAWKQQHMFIDI